MKSVKDGESVNNKYRNHPNNPKCDSIGKHAGALPACNGVSISVVEHRSQNNPINDSVAKVESVNNKYRSQPNNPRCDSVVIRESGTALPACDGIQHRSQYNPSIDSVEKSVKYGESGNIKFRNQTNKPNSDSDEEAADVKRRSQNNPSNDSVVKYVPILNRSGGSVNVKLRDTSQGDINISQVCLPSKYNSSQQNAVQRKDFDEYTNNPFDVEYEDNLEFDDESGLTNTMYDPFNVDTDIDDEIYFLCEDSTVNSSHKVLVNDPSNTDFDYLFDDDNECYWDGDDEDYCDEDNEVDDLYYNLWHGAKTCLWSGTWHLLNYVTGVCQYFLDAMDNDFRGCRVNDNAEEVYIDINDYTKHASFGKETTSGVVITELNETDTNTELHVDMSGNNFELLKSNNSGKRGNIIETVDVMNNRTNSTSIYTEISNLITSGKVNKFIILSDIYTKFRINSHIVTSKASNKNLIIDTASRYHSCNIVKELCFDPIFNTNNKIGSSDLYATNGFARMNSLIVAPVMLNRNYIEDSMNRCMNTDNEQIGKEEAGDSETVDCFTRNTGESGAVDTSNKNKPEDANVDNNLADNSKMPDNTDMNTPTNVDTNSVDNSKMSDVNKANDNTNENIVVDPNAGVTSGNEMQNTFNINTIENNTSVESSNNEVEKDLTDSDAVKIIEQGIIANISDEDDITRPGKPDNTVVGPTETIENSSTFDRKALDSKDNSSIVENTGSQSIIDDHMNNLIINNVVNKETTSTSNLLDPITYEDVDTAKVDETIEYCLKEIESLTALQDSNVPSEESSITKNVLDSAKEIRSLSGSEASQHARATNESINQTFTKNAIDCISKNNNAQDKNIIGDSEASNAKKDPYFTLRKLLTTDFRKMDNNPGFSSTASSAGLNNLQTNTSKAFEVEKPGGKTILEDGSFNSKQNEDSTVKCVKVKSQNERVEKCLSMSDIISTAFACATPSYLNMDFNGYNTNNYEVNYDYDVNNIGSNVIEYSHLERAEDTVDNGRLLSFNSHTGYSNTENININCNTTLLELQPNVVKPTTDSDSSIVRDNDFYNDCDEDDEIPRKIRRKGKVPWKSKTLKEATKKNSIDNPIASTSRVRVPSPVFPDVGTLKRKGINFSSSSSYDSYDSLDLINDDDPSDGDLESRNKIKKFIISKAQPLRTKRKKVDMEPDTQQSTNQLKLNQSNSKHANGSKVDGKKKVVPIKLTLKAVPAILIVTPAGNKQEKALNTERNPSNEFTTTPTNPTNQTKVVRINPIDQSKVPTNVNTQTKAIPTNPINQSKAIPTNPINPSQAVPTNSKANVTPAKLLQNILRGSYKIINKDVAPIGIDLSSGVDQGNRSINKKKNPVQESVNKTAEKQKGLLEKCAEKPIDNNVPIIEIDSDSDPDDNEKKQKIAHVSVPKPIVKRQISGGFTPNYRKVRIVSIKRKVIDKERFGIETIGLDNDDKSKDESSNQSGKGKGTGRIGIVEPVNAMDIQNVQINKDKIMATSVEADCDTRTQPIGNNDTEINSFIEGDTVNNEGENTVQIENSGDCHSETDLDTLIEDLLAENISIENQTEDNALLGSNIIDFIPDSDEFSLNEPFTDTNSKQSSVKYYGVDFDDVDFNMAELFAPEMIDEEDINRHNERKGTDLKENANSDSKEPVDAFDDDFDLMDEATQNLIEKYTHEDNAAKKMEEPACNDNETVTFNEEIGPKPFIDFDPDSYVEAYVDGYIFNDINDNEDCDPESFIEKEFVDYILDDDRGKYSGLRNEKLIDVNVNDTCTSSASPESTIENANYGEGINKTEENNLSILIGVSSTPDKENEKENITDDKSQSDDNSDMDDANLTDNGDNFSDNEGRSSGVVNDANLTDKDMSDIEHDNDRTTNTLTIPNNDGEGDFETNDISMENDKEDSSADLDDTNIGQAVSNNNLSEEILEIELSTERDNITIEAVEITSNTEQEMEVDKECDFDVDNENIDDLETVENTDKEGNADTENATAEQNLNETDNDCDAIRNDGSEMMADIVNDDEVLNSNNEEDLIDTYDNRSDKNVGNRNDVDARSKNTHNTILGNTDTQKVGDCATTNIKEGNTIMEIQKTQINDVNTSGVEVFSRTEADDKRYKIYKPGHNPENIPGPSQAITEVTSILNPLNVSKIKLKEHNTGEYSGNSSVAVAVNDNAELEVEPTEYYTESPLDLSKKDQEYDSDTPLDLCVPRSRTGSNQATTSNIRFSIDNILNVFGAHKTDSERNCSNLQRVLSNKQRKFMKLNGFEESEKNKQYDSSLQRILLERQRKFNTNTPRVVKPSNMDMCRVRCRPERAVMNSVPPPIMVF